MTDSTTEKPGGSDVAAVKKLGEAREQILAELRKTIVGMEEVIDESLIAIFARGHVLLEGLLRNRFSDPGVPGRLSGGVGGGANVTSALPSRKTCGKRLPTSPFRKCNHGKQGRARLRRVSLLSDIHRPCRRSGVSVGQCWPTNPDSW